VTPQTVESPEQLVERWKFCSSTAKQAQSTIEEMEQLIRDTEQQMMDAWTPLRRFDHCRVVSDIPPETVPITKRWALSGITLTVVSRMFICDPQRVPIGVCCDVRDPHDMRRMVVIPAKYLKRVDQEAPKASDI
jgi:hypothetical protein